MPHTTAADTSIRGWKPAPQPLHPARRGVRRVSCMLLLFAAALFALPALTAPRRTDAPPLAEGLPAAVQAVPSLPENIVPALPPSLETAAAVVPRERLLQGRMLLIDSAHPLPADWLPADSTGVLLHSAGRIACRDLSACLGQDTLDALAALFAAARRENISQLTVFAGTRSPEQQRQLQTDTFAMLARDMSLDDALAQTYQAAASPGCSEHQSTWAVDIRICPQWNGPPSQAPLHDSAAGQWLLDNAWRYGFIQPWGSSEGEGLCREWHFRYVGRAHAMLMHALSLPFADYLALLSQHGTLTLLDENGAPLATAVCAAAGERQASFHIPQICMAEDMSLDNMGHAILSCLYPSDNTAPAR